jgi:3-hydroxyisobutyrate dehydrogenase-like beta-hydroxyacid dehydrogenase
LEILIKEPEMNVAFIGLGVMGHHMAGHLSRAGHTVNVFNRTHSKAESWIKEFGGTMHGSPRDACANGVEAAFLCVGDDPDVKDVVLGPDGALSVMKEGSVIVDHTTTSADLARQLSEMCMEQSVGFVDAPVSGGEQGAKNGALTVMCGGDEKSFNKVEPIIKSYAAFIKHIGDVGAGQLAKMVNQICIGGIIQGLSEGLHFGEKAGLNMAAVIEAISKGAAQSWQMDNRAETMLAGNFDFGFAVDWMLKDLRICLEQAQSLDANLPLTKMVREYYEDVKQAGGGRWDTSSLIVRLRNCRT